MLNTFVFDDGGRSAAGYRGSAGDCVTRAIAIACSMPYQAAYELVNAAGKRESLPKRFKGQSSARKGVYKPTIRAVLASLGWQWHPTMYIGQGCKVHVRESELPSGVLILSLSKHLTVMINGVIHDTFDPSRSGTRCVYGYWSQIR